MGMDDRILIELAKTVLALEKRIKALENPKRRKVGGMVHVVGAAGEMGEIVASVATSYGVDFSMVMGRCTAPTFSYPRQHAYALCSEAGYSLGSIGRFFDRNHATIRDGIAAHRERVADQ